MIVIGTFVFLLFISSLDLEAAATVSVVLSASSSSSSCDYELELSKSGRCLSCLHDGVSKDDEHRDDMMGARINAHI